MIWKKIIIWWNSETLSFDWLRWNVHSIQKNTLIKFGDTDWLRCRKFCIKTCRKFEKKSKETLRYSNGNGWKAACEKIRIFESLEKTWTQSSFRHGTVSTVQIISDDCWTTIWLCCIWWWRRLPLKSDRRHATYAQLVSLKRSSLCRRKQAAHLPIVALFLRLWTSTNSECIFLVWGNAVGAVLLAERHWLVDRHWKLHPLPLVVSVSQMAVTLGPQFHHLLWWTPWCCLSSSDCRLATTEFPLPLDPVLPVEHPPTLTGNSVMRPALYS